MYKCNLLQLVPVQERWGTGKENVKDPAFSSAVAVKDAGTFCARLGGGCDSPSARCMLHYVDFGFLEDFRGGETASMKSGGRDGREGGGDARDRGREWDGRGVVGKETSGVGAPVALVLSVALCDVMWLERCMIGSGDGRIGGVRTSWGLDVDSET